jgi:hypothetical protein
MTSRKSDADFRVSITNPVPTLKAGGKAIASN